MTIPVNELFLFQFPWNHQNFLYSSYQLGFFSVSKMLTFIEASFHLLVRTLETLVSFSYEH